MHFQESGVTTCRVSSMSSYEFPRKLRSKHSKEVQGPNLSNALKRRDKSTKLVRSLNSGRTRQLHLPRRARPQHTVAKKRGIIASIECLPLPLCKPTISLHDERPQPTLPKRLRLPSAAILTVAGCDAASSGAWKKTSRSPPRIVPVCAWTCHTPPPPAESLGAWFCPLGRRVQQPNLLVASFRSQSDGGSEASRPVDRSLECLRKPSRERLSCIAASPPGSPDRAFPTKCFASCRGRAECWWSRSTGAWSCPS